MEAPDESIEATEVCPHTSMEMKEKTLPRPLPAKREKAVTDATTACRRS